MAMRIMSCGSKRHRLLLSSGLMAIVSTLGAQHALAQEMSADQVAVAGAGSVAQVEVAQEPVGQAQRDSSTAIEDIVVTARRREENLRDIPISAQALSSETIATRGIVALEQLSTYTPNFRQTSAIISPYRAMRGISSGSNFSFDQAVGAFTDGVYIGRAQLGRIPFFDIERVEVLRGPQVILFGNSTTAGAISSTTRRPGHEFEANIRGSYEFNNQETILEGGITVPLSERFSVRVAGYMQQLDRGWLQSNFNGTRTQDPRIDTSAFRVTAVWNVTDDLTASIRYEHANVRIDGGTQQAVANRNNNPLVGEINFDDFRTVGSGPPLGIDNQNGIPNDLIRFRPDIVLGRIEYRFGDFTLTSQTALVEFDYFQTVESDWITTPFAQIVQNEEYRQFSQELRLAGTIGRLDLQVGGYYQSDSKVGDFRFDFNFPAVGLTLPAFGLRSTADYDTDSWSLFADVNYRLTDRLRIGVGARYTRTTRVTDQTNHASVIGTGARNTAVETTIAAPGRTIFNLVGGTPHDYLGIEDSESHFQPQALVQYNFTDDVMGYFRFVRGAKAGGYDWLYRGADPRGGIFLPETATSYEAGIKGLIFDRSLSFEIQFYRTEFSNLQVSAFDGVASLIVRNAAEQLSQGVELEATWRATPRLTFNFSGAYLDATYTDFPSGACNYFSRIATPAGTVCRQDYTGTRPAFQSEWSGNLGVSYEATAGAFTITPRVDLSYRSSYNASTNDDPGGLQPGYVLTDFRVDLTRDGAPWTISVFGRNIFNERFMEFFLDAPSITGLSSAVINRGRQVGIQASARF